MQLTPSTQTHHVEVLHGKIAQAANVGEDHVGNDDTRVVVHVLLNIFEEVFAHLLAPDVEDSAEVMIEERSRCSLNVWRQTAVLSISNDFRQIKQNHASLDARVILANTLQCLTTTTTNIHNGNSAFSSRGVKLQRLLERECTGAVTNTSQTHTSIPGLNALGIGLQVLHVSQFGTEADLEGTMVVVTNMLPVRLGAELGDSEDSVADEVVHLSSEGDVVVREVGPGENVLFVGFNAGLFEEMGAGAGTEDAS
ncbi:hypothetical protein TMatcc_002321 [Talaromyces marneffei ATCC 18224]